MSPFVDALWRVARSITLGCLGLLAAAGLSARAAEPFQPLESDPLLESWRWRRFEQLDGRGFRCMAEAEDGSLWFGFKEQAVHFDGLRETVYGETDGVLGAPVKSIHVARDGAVYALTRTHFLCFDGRRWRTLATIDNQSVPGNRLREAPDGAIWALTQDELLCFRQSALLRFAEMPRPLADFAIDARNTLWLVPQNGGVVWECPINEGTLARRETWIGHAVFPGRSATQFNALATRDGAVWIVTGSEKLPAARFDLASRQWERIDLRTSGGSLNDYAITEAADGTVWIAGRGRLHALRRGEVTVYTQAELSSMPFYRYTLHATRDGALWLCGVGGYIYRIDCSDRRWSSYLDIGFQTQGPDGVRWFITRDHRVVAHDPRARRWTQFSAADGLMERPVAVLAARDGTVWAAGSDREQAAIARWDGGRWRLDRHPRFARGVARQSLYETRNGDMVFGAEFEPANSPGCSGGLLRYRFDGREWQVTSIAPPAVPFRVLSVAESDDGSLWLGGDNVWRVQDGQAIDTGFPHTAEPRSSFHVARDARGAIWVSKWGGGVYRHDRGRWERFTTRDGLASELVAAVAGSPTGGVWAGSPAALSRHDGERWNKAVLPAHFGLDLGPSHLRVAPDGAVWIVAAAQGWYGPRRAVAQATAAAAHPLRSFRYQPERDPPETILRAGPLEVMENQPAVFVWDGADRWLETRDEALEFSYRVNGGRWSAFSRERSATLGDLRPGRHTLEVRARDGDHNIDPSPARAIFAIVPPVWRQPWFLALIAVFTAAVAVLVWLLVRLRIRHVLQLGELKAQFFTNISHELRTPLTVILGPLERMLGETREPRTRERLETIWRNAKHMLALVDQILDFRRLQVRGLASARERLDVVALLRAQHERLKAYAEDKALAFAFRATPPVFCARVDPDALIKIADNLVGNAIKYTPAGGEVIVELVCAPGQLTLRVTDSGIGIPASEQSKVFDVFYRVGDTRAAAVRGAGLGLAFVRELIEHQSGEIAVHSPAFPIDAPERGSCFTVVLPVELEAGAEDSAATGASPAAPVPLPALAPAQVALEASGKPTLLIVDDNDDLRRLLRDEFEESYVVLDAEHGARGLALAQEHVPDCVIADVMMPELDGEALCARLKATELTAHVPVVLLTARGSPESEMRGLNAGADDYVAKPVSFAVLKARVNNLIVGRAKLRERFGRQVYLAPQEVAITPADEQFIQRALRIVEEHMSDPEFDVERFARALGLSRASLFRKFKGISGQSPSEFIRNMRLERARQLLASGEFNVSQTAGQAGFLDLSHFAACFRKRFGISPSDCVKAGVGAPAADSR